MPVESTLEFIVKGILYSNPNNAHTVIEEYLFRNNASPNEIQIFQTCWTKTVLAHESFGQTSIFTEAKNKENINEIKDFDKKIEIFAKDLINELVKSFKHIHQIDNFKSLIENDLIYYNKKLEDIKTNPLKKEELITILTDTSKISETLSTMLLHSMSYNISSNIPMTSLNLSYIQYEQSLSLRVLLQKYKIIYINDFPSFRSIYLPIDSIYHGQINIKYGELRLKQSIHTSITNDFIDMDSIIHITIKNQNNYENKSYITYQCLIDCFLSYQLTIYPKVINTIRDTITLQCSFLYEYPLCKPLINYMNINFIINLYKYSDIILLWCKQLAIGYVSITLLNYKLYNNLNINNINIKDDGRLILSNLCFHDDNNINELIIKEHNCNYYINFIKQFLGYILGLSQYHNIKFDNTNELNYILIVNHEIKLSFNDYRNYQIIIRLNNNIDDEINNIINNQINYPIDRIIINIFGDNKIYSINSYDKYNSLDILQLNESPYIIIKTNQCGYIKLHISLERINDNKIIIQNELIIHINIIMKPITYSPDLLELISLINLSYNNNNDYIRYSNSFYQCLYDYNNRNENIIVDNIRKMNESYNHENILNIWRNVINNNSTNEETNIQKEKIL